MRLSLLSVSFWRTMAVPSSVQFPLAVCIYYRGRKKTRTETIADERGTSHFKSDMERRWGRGGAVAPVHGRRGWLPLPHDIAGALRRPYPPLPRQGASAAAARAHDPTLFSGRADEPA